MQHAALRPPTATLLAPGSAQERRLEMSLAKPNYRHQKKQKELARKTRHAEKLKKRLERDEVAPADGSDLQTTAPEAPAIESKP